MVARKITVTREDYSQLVELLRDKLLSMIAERGTVRELAGELEKARIVDARHVSPDVVTMNSTVQLTDLSSGETETFTLVYPDEANINEGKLSIFAPIGIAILGYRVSDRVSWKVPAGTIELRIDKVTHPRAAGLAVA